jgi:hypothetical protein
MAEEQRMPLLLDTLGRLFGELPNDAEIGVVNSNHRADVLLRLTSVGLNKHWEILGQIAAITPDGGTCLRSGVERALSMLPDGGALLCLSDGYDHECAWGIGRAWSILLGWNDQGERDVDHLAAQARKQGVTIHSVMLGDGPTDSPMVKFAEATGGKCNVVYDHRSALEKAPAIISALLSDSGSRDSVVSHSCEVSCVIRGVAQFSPPRSPDTGVPAVRLLDDAVTVTKPLDREQFEEIATLAFAGKHDRRPQPPSVSATTFHPQGVEREDFWRVHGLDYREPECLAL